MRFYKRQHRFYCGIDLHARSMYLCIRDRDDAVLLHQQRIDVDGFDHVAKIAGEAAEPAEEVQVSLTEQAVRNAVETLPDREREVVKLRFGMDGDPHPQSLEEIGRRLGLTRERVRQIEGTALERLAVNREIEALRTAA